MTDRQITIHRKLQTTEWERITLYESELADLDDGSEGMTQLLVALQRALIECEPGTGGELDVTEDSAIPSALWAFDYWKSEDVDSDEILAADFTVES